MNYQDNDRHYRRQRAQKQRQRAIRRRAQRAAARKGQAYAAWNALPEGLEREGACGERKEG